MILWLLYGLIGGTGVIPPPPPLPDITGNINYYRQWLDDSIIIESTSSLPAGSTITPTSEDLDYFRRRLCDI